MSCARQTGRQGFVSSALDRGLKTTDIWDKLDQQELGSIQGHLANPMNLIIPTLGPRAPHGIKCDLSPAFATKTTRGLLCPLSVLARP